MTCYYPIQMFRSRSGRNPATGAWPLVFDTVKGYGDLPVIIPCGRCIGCRLDRSKQWAVRCIHEAQQYSLNCFITLTFDDDHLDKNLSLVKEDYVKFMKRLRRHVDYHALGSNIRFFHCGEYGSLNLRPHHHAIIFNFDFPDKTLWSENNKIKLYRSAILESLWPFGFCTIGDVTFDSAAYVARYIMKKVTGPMAEHHYQGRLPEYITMSRRPGISSEWIKTFYADVYPHDYLVIRNSVKCKPPRYYDKIYDTIDPKSMKHVKYIRVKNARENSENSTPDRLEIREKIVLYRLNQLVRKI